MAAIQTQGQPGGKKAVDAEIPLVPFIDLLLCCIMFLLVTAVWNQLGSLSVNQRTGPTPDAPPVLQHESLILQMGHGGYVLASTTGDRLEIPRSEDRYDTVALRERLEERRRMAPNMRAIVLAPEDGIDYAQIIETMDTLTGTGFDDVSLSDGGAL